MDYLKRSSSSMWICCITSTFKLNSWEVMRLYSLRFSGWATVTVVFYGSSNSNSQGWSSKNIRSLHIIRYTIWRTYTIRLAVALLVEEHRNTIPACLRGVLLSGMLMSDQRWISWCTLSDGKRNYVPHTWYRAFILNSLMQFLLRQKTPRYMNMEILLGCYPPPVANVLCGGMRKLDCQHCLLQLPLVY